MNICVVGINHKTTPVAVRSKVIVSSDRLIECLQNLNCDDSQGMILCTCNRTEIYTLARSTKAAEAAAIEFLKAQTHLPEEDLLPCLYIHHDEAAVHHLFSVASGLDSMIVGEYEILGQVGNALAKAEESEVVKLPLLEFFRRAVRVGRRVRKETAISKNALSVSSLAVDLATNIISDMKSCKVLVAGAGEAGKLVAKAVRDQGADKVTIASRSAERAAVLANMLHANWVPLKELAIEMAIADIVISCTGAPHTIINLSQVEKTMSLRPDRPLVIIDIAVPQDVESAVGQLNNVYLYDIDHLNELSSENRELRQREMASSFEIVDDEVRRFSGWWHTLGARPVIAALVQKAEKIRQTQLKLTLKQHPELSDIGQEYLDIMTKAIVQKVLHDPIAYLKSNGHTEQDSVETVKDIFNLRDEKKK